MNVPCLCRFEEALADARKALGFDPENHDLVRLMASIHMARGENEEAGALLRSLVSEQEQVREARRAVDVREEPRHVHVDGVRFGWLSWKDVGLIPRIARFRALA